MNPTVKPVPAVDELRDDVEVLRHFDGCADPRLATYRGTRGDAMLQCRECGKFRPMRQWMLTDTRAVMEAPPEPPQLTAVTLLAPPLPPTPPALVSTFRCRTHTDQPVSWKGRGCPQC